MACLGATIPDMGGSSMYVLSLEARSVGLRNPKFCIYARGPDRCSTLPTAMTWKGWTPYSTVVHADPEAIETRLYLYGLRDLAEKRTSQVEYRQVRLRPVASPSTIVLVRQDSASTKTAGYTWRRANPTRFPATVTSTEGTVAALYETFAPGWAAPGISTRSEHVALQGWMNGWRVPAGRHTGAFSYTPEGRARLARLALPAGLVAAAVWIVLARWWRSRRRRRRE
jgi:arabinofuranan 3-O-arabinosyltransferase